MLYKLKSKAYKAKSLSLKKILWKKDNLSEYNFVY